MALIDASRAGLAAVGREVSIYEMTRITAPERVSLGSNVVIDDFVFLQGGERLEIGSFVHIASFASVTGGGVGVIGAFTGLSSGSRILTGTDLTDGSGLMGPGVPTRMRAVRRGRTELGEHVLIGANAVVMPDVHVGTGAVIGACAVVTQDIEPWTINVGAPARPIKHRPSEAILAYARQLGFAPGGTGGD
jgi:acetyltransferase-like isoleucine patch superfamily enzyme